MSLYVYGVLPMDSNVGNKITRQYYLDIPMLGFRVLKTLQEIQRQKNSKESTVQGAAVGRKRKSKKCLHFGKLEKDITSYKVFSYFFFNCLKISKPRRISTDIAM